MDIPWLYRGWNYKKHLSRKEIENMKKNMKKVPEIQLKTEIYHNKEIHEANNILDKISSPPTPIILSSSESQKNTWYLQNFISLRHRFISLF